MARTICDRSNSSRTALRASSFALSLLTTGLAASGAAWSQSSPQGVRGEVEIRLVRQPSGAPSFALPLQVGGQTVVAGLDTGSSGVRLMPSAQHGLRPGDDPGQRTYGYGSGISITGPEATADVAFGEVRGAVEVQAVQRVGCIHPDAPCAVASRPVDEYGFFSGKQPNRGFKAILGASPNPQGGIVNPWLQLGVRRWILSLPRPGEDRPGRLILNPAPADMAGFRPVPSGAKPWQLATCVERMGPARCASAGPTCSTAAPPVGSGSSTSARTAAGRAARHWSSTSATAPPATFGSTSSLATHARASNSRSAMTPAIRA